jgi:hypothetical protein
VVMVPTAVMMPVNMMSLPHSGRENPTCEQLLDGGR